MPDLHSVYDRPVPPHAIPDGFFDYRGVILPDGSDFDREDLVDVARVNGFRLGADTLKNWRRWRLVPAPVAGGKTRHGRGKGETWSRDAARRVAWLAYWKAAGASYAVLTLALWPFTPELDTVLVQVGQRLREFVYSDRANQDRARRRANPANASARAVLDAYERVLEFGEWRLNEVALLLDDAGLKPTDSEYVPSAKELRTLTFDELERTVEAAEPKMLREFIDRFRDSVASTPAFIDAINLAAETNPKGAARIIVRELHRFQRAQEEQIKLHDDG